MPVIVIANPKGGAGKSTLATNIAGLLAQQGHAVMLGDVDRQQSSRQWLAQRPAVLPPILAWEAGADGVLRPPKGTSHVVIDTPAGLDGELLDNVMRMATKVVVPVQASLFDIQATHAFVQRLRAHPRRTQFALGAVAMRVRENTIAADRLVQYLEQLQVPLLARLRDTQNYVHLAAQGLTLWDVTPTRVERDVEQWQVLARWILQ
jgi:chromosome partitioning protein